MLRKRIQDLLPQSGKKTESDNIYFSESAVIEEEEIEITAQEEMSPPQANKELGYDHKEASTQVAKIKLPKIKSDKGYMEKISLATDTYGMYLFLRETYMRTPDFYYAVSDFFYRKGQKEKGLLILSSLAELEIENTSLFKMLAFRLKEKGEYAHELFVTEKILSWRPMDLQSHRDYALALQDNGRYQEALESLYGLLNASYSPEAAWSNADIEEVVVCEINNLISLQRKKLDLSKIDSRLIAHLPVDVRVVINWNRKQVSGVEDAKKPSAGKFDFALIYKKFIYVLVAFLFVFGLVALYFMRKR